MNIQIACRATNVRLPRKNPFLAMRSVLIAAGVAFAVAAPLSAGAVTKDEACQTFATKLNAAQASGDKAKAQEIYTKGSQRIAKKFNGATCPNVKAPAN